MRQDFGHILDSMLGELNGEDESKRAVASAAVAMLLTQAPEGAKLPPSAVHALVPLLQDQNPLIQVCVRPLCLPSALCP